MAYINTYYFQINSSGGLVLKDEEHKHSILPVTKANDVTVGIAQDIFSGKSNTVFDAAFPDMTRDKKLSSFVSWMNEKAESVGLANNMDEFYCRAGFGVYGCSKPGIDIMVMINSENRI